MYFGYAIFSKSIDTGIKKDKREMYLSKANGIN
jgi:hypothetical protein